MSVLLSALRLVVRDAAKAVGAALPSSAEANGPKLPSRRCKVGRNSGVVGVGSCQRARFLDAAEMAARACGPTAGDWLSCRRATAEARGVKA